ncbi:MAG TPA: aldolase/citrate lyase family protein [Rhizomicrobium sp.]
MNHFERHMVDLLLRARNQHGVLGIKAEFEAEGTRPDELLRLLNITHKAGLKVALKIGGCEAVSDLMSSRLYGADYVIAPMVETPYALSKFIDAKDKVYPDSAFTKFLFNVETDTTLRSLPEMLRIAKRGVDGIVFGRVDFTCSRGMPRQSVNDRSITDAVMEVAAACARTNLEFVVGGSVSTAAIDVLREVRTIRLDRFETRKVIFDGAAIESASIDTGIALAVEFELTWLKSKRDYYSRIAAEDDARIEMMEARARLALSNPSRHLKTA